MDGRGGAFFADEIDDDTVLGSDDGIFAWTATYIGVFAGFGQAGNRIIDVDGFANWGNPGSTVDYDTSGFIGGALIGKKFKIGGVPLRIELDGMVGKVSATSSRLDPEGLDETVQSVCCQIATARAGIEQPVGAATIFAAGGLAAARIEHSVTDIDFGPNMPPRSVKGGAKVDHGGGGKVDHPAGGAASRREASGRRGGCGSISPRRCGCFVAGNPARFSPFGVGEPVGEHDVFPSTGTAGKTDPDDI